MNGRSILRRASVCALALASLGTALGCTPTTFQTTLGGDDADSPIGISPTADGGYAVCGVVGMDSRTLWMGKLDATGTLAWQRSAAANRPGWTGACLAETDGYVLVTSVEVPGPPPVDDWNQPYLFETDLDGNERSAITLTSTADEVVKAVTPTSNGRFAVTGWYQDGSDRGVRVLLSEIDLDGNRHWTEATDHDGSQHGQAVTRLTNGELLVAGNDGASLVYAPLHPHLERVDPAGGRLWSRTYDELGQGSFEAIGERSDGTWIAAGYLGPRIYAKGAAAESPSANDLDAALVMALAADGTPLWTKVYEPGLVLFDDLAVLPNDDVVLTGTSTDGTFDGQDVVLTRLDGTGAELWTRRYGGGLSEHSQSLAPTADGGFVVVASTWSYGLGNGDLLVIKTDGIGQTGPAPS